MTAKAAAALKQFPETTRDDYAALKEALQRHFEPASKKELYMAEFQVRRKRKDEDWASFGDNLQLLAEKSYLNLTAEAQEVLALNCYLTQLDSPQISFSVRQKQPTNIDQAVQYTLEAESYLIHPYKQQNLTTSTLPIAPLLPQSSVDKLPNTEQPVVTEQLVAAVPTTSDPMSLIMKRLDEIETQLKVVVSFKKKWDRRSKPPESR